MTNNPMSHEAPAIIEHFLASGEITADQLPGRAVAWTPERKLAAAILTSALLEIREYAAARSHRLTVERDLAWVYSDDAEWPFSFVRLCEEFALNPAWVRKQVRRWVDGDVEADLPRPRHLFRRAA